jgi:hypothetical protein
MPPPSDSPLPYTDTKPVGAADFYFAINATFRFIQEKFGVEGLRRYWRELGANYYAPVSARWGAGGLAAIADYWRAFFAAEPGADVDVSESGDVVRLQVKRCPMIAHLRAGGREIVPCFCQHCYFVSEAMAAPAGFTVRVRGGNGACTQTFHSQSAAPPPQELAQIEEAR